jgi:4,5-DOPA dioxygenase extradiol
LNRNESSSIAHIHRMNANLHALYSLPKTPRFPVLFVGHGSPMNALEENAFTQTWAQTARNLPRPQAILCISAHWMTEGVAVTAMPNPKTIHDFGGFPDALFNVQYPAPGSPSLANAVKTTLQTHTTAVLDHEHWGLDHGCWSVLCKMYPDASVPVVQMSLDVRLTFAQHRALGAQLQPLRERGVLIVASGNMVHNLGRLDWYSPLSGYDWADEANEGFKKALLQRDTALLDRLPDASSAFRLAVPTPDHYWPLLYATGLQRTDENVQFFNDQVVMGSISMTSVLIGA